MRIKNYKTTINLWDLCKERVYIKIKQPYLRDLFNCVIKFLGTQHRLANLLNRSNGNICNYKSGRYFVPLKIVMKILDLLPEIEREKFRDIITKNLDEIKLGYGRAKSIKKFPINFSAPLARIIGHLIGDGGINKANRLFYSNKYHELIEIFKEDMKRVFGNVNVEEYTRKKGYIVFYPTITGIILKHLIGPMRGKFKHVPSLIFSADRQSKSLFIRALFDDEGNVSVEKSTIQINITKKSILRDIKRLLLEFDIVGGKIGKVKREMKKDMFVMRISGREHIMLFSRYIGFDHPEKREDLNELIESYSQKRIRYGKAKLTRERILEILERSGRATKYEIAKKLGRSPTSLKYHLLTLERKGKITSKKYKLLKVYSPKR